MTSKISCFNIAKEDLRHRSWMLALSCLGSILSLPVLFLLANGNYLNTYAAKGRERVLLLPVAYANFFSNSMVSQGIILFIGAGIVAILGFRYLYSRRMVDLYHSLPIKRNRLFLITYLNGLLIWLIPMLLSVGLTLLIMFANLAALGIPGTIGNILITAVKAMLVYIMAFLTVYHFCLVCIMLCGNAVNALCTTAVTGTIAVVVYAIIIAYCDLFFDTYVEWNLSLEQVAWASPLISPILILADGVSSISGSGISISESTYPHPAFFYTACLIMIIVMLIAALKLYEKRPSELAEHGVDNPWYQSFIRISGSFITAMCGALLFISILDKEEIGWQLFGIVLCGCFSFGVLDIILHMNFRSFFRHKIQMIIAVIASALFLLTFTWDLTGYDTRLPDQEDIETASLNLNRYRDDNWNWIFDENGIAGPRNNKGTPMKYRDISALYPLLESLSQEDHQVTGAYVTSTNVELTLKNGSIFKRRYYLYESDVDALRTIVNSDEYRSAWYPVSSGLYPTPESLQINSELNFVQNQINDSAHIQEILEAYYADFSENYSLDNLLADIQIGSLYLHYPYSHGDTANTYTMAVTLKLYENYKRTLDVINKYYPEIVLDRSQTQITQLKIAADMADEGMILLPERAADMAQTDSIMITDPDAIEKLSPFLYPGSYSRSPFSTLARYQYLGDITTSRGHHLACYVPIAELPIDLSGLPITISE